MHPLKRLATMKAGYGKEERKLPLQKRLTNNNGFGLEKEEEVPIQLPLLPMVS